MAEPAGTITSAAAVMISVFAIFATLSLLEMKMIGVGLSVAILVDATLIRLVMLPAILVLLGDRAWGPAEQQARSRFVFAPRASQPHVTPRMDDAPPIPGRLMTGPHYNTSGRHHDPTLLPPIVMTS